METSNPHKKPPLSRVLVGGSGPAGLTAAYLLSKRGVPNEVHETESDVGGIAKTVRYGGCRFDLGGHRFFTKIKIVKELWSEVMDEEMPVRKRISSIYYNNKFFNYPLSTLNVLKNLGLIESVIIFMSYIKARVLGSGKTGSFEDYVVYRFGRRLYETFFKTYTEKIWGVPCSEIRDVWAAQRIKDMSFTSVLKSTILNNRKNIRSLIDEFQYPKYGPGQMWEKMIEKTKTMGGNIVTESEVVGVNLDGNIVKSVSVKRSGEIRDLSVDHFITTLPLKDLILMIQPIPPQKVIAAAKRLKYRELIVIALIIDEANSWRETWIYIHDKKVGVSRIQNYNNWSSHMVSSEDKTCIGMEYFCFEGDEIWNMYDDKLIKLASDELVSLSFFDVKSKSVDGKVVRVKKAYPVYDIGFRENVKTIIGYLSTIDNLHSIGRNGMHRYNNMDHSMLTALYAVENIFGAKHNIWSINEEQTYHEK